MFCVVQQCARCDALHCATISSVAVVGHEVSVSNAEDESDESEARSDPFHAPRCPPHPTPFPAQHAADCTRFQEEMRPPQCARDSVVVDASEEMEVEVLVAVVASAVDKIIVFIILF